MSATQIFVNLPVADIDKAKAFYTSLGFSLNPQFSDDKTGCVVIAENICAMIMTHDRFKDFTSRDVATDGIEVINSIGVTTRDGVDHLANTAFANGGAEVRPTEDMGWMYQRSFTDPDGHHWEAVHVDEEAMAEAFASGDTPA